MKNKINKHALFLALFIAFLFWHCGSVRALEVTLKGLDNNSTLTQYVGFIFGWAITVGASLAVISFAVGAVSLIISGDSEESRSNAKDRMKSAILGLLLIMGSYVIINTINPAIVGLPMSALPPEPVINITIPPGVYFCLGGCSGSNSCDGISGANTSYLDKIPDPFYKNIRSVVIVNDPANYLNYGVILHAANGLKSGGECSLPITAPGCHAVDTPAAAADIMALKQFSGEAGDGVTFFSEPSGTARAANAGYLDILDEKINSPFTQFDPSKMCYDWTNVNVPDEYKYTCNRGSCPARPNDARCSDFAWSTFQVKPGSIDMQGSYLVALYSKIIGSTKPYCQTFDNNVPDLNTEPFVASGVKKIDTVYIFPIE